MSDAGWRHKLFMDSIRNSTRALRGWERHKKKPPECNCPQATPGVTDDPCPVHGGKPNRRAPEGGAE